MPRPKFLKSLLDSWQLTYAHGKAFDLVPYWIALSGAVGFFAARSLPLSFWNGEKLDVAVSVMSGLLTFNGIILALCWSAFGKIYEIIGAGSFCAHLRKQHLLNHYLFFVVWCHIAQVAAICLTALALFALWLPLELWAVKSLVGLAIAASAYALRQGVATSSVMQDLIWQKSEFDEREKGLKVAGGSPKEGEA